MKILKLFESLKLFGKSSKELPKFAKQVIVYNGLPVSDCVFFKSNIKSIDGEILLDAVIKINPQTVEIISQLADSHRFALIAIKNGENRGDQIISIYE